MPEKTDTNELTPVELSEIERIVSQLPGGEGIQAGDSPAEPSHVSAEEPAFEPYEGAPSEYGGYVNEYDEPAEETAPTDDFEDITGMIHELPESEAEGESSTIEPAADFDFTMPDAEAEPEEDILIPETPSFGRIDSIEEAEEPEEPSGARSVLDDLDALTASEPLAVDAQEIPADIYNPSDFDSVSDIPVEKEDEFPSFGDTSFEEVQGSEPPASEEPSFGMDFGGTTEDLPDLSDISAPDVKGIEEAAPSDIPDISLDSFGSLGSTMDIEEPVSVAEPKRSSFEDMTSFDSPLIDEEPEIPSMLADELPDIPTMGAIDDIISHEPISDMRFDDHQESSRDDMSSMDFGETTSSFAPEIEPESEPDRGGGIDLSDSELRRLKTALLLFPPALIRAVKDAILRDTLSESDTRTLVNIVLTGRGENDVRRFLEDKLHTKIDMSEGTGKRRVLSSRREYSSSSSRERQKVLFKRTRIFAAVAIVLGIGSVLMYNYVYKPYKAKTYISEGVALILKKADIGDEMKNYEKAEALFSKVDNEYVKDYMPGYNRYGRAYFDKKQYGRSLAKLNAAYNIRPYDLDTLNNLGFFYKKVPDRVYEEDLKPNLRKMYYEKSLPAVERITDKYDVARDFYLKARNIDPKNITALVGIGDVYFQKGEYFKARQYYESILKIDPQSVAGHAGLMNLFIERDSVQEFFTSFAVMRDKELLEQMPSALLAKSAWYLLTKKADGDKNIRIDYGIESERLKDKSDNPYPAVRTILNALHKRDPDYPPLYVMYAKLSIAQKNLKMAKGYLEQAIEHAEKKGQRYFGALSMMGEYYYRIKDPVRSYKYLNESLAALNYPAEFTQDDFYKETEHSGRTKAVMGNIFYYYFDKVTSRFGDNKDEESLEEGAPAAEASKLLNYDVAMRKYEAAVADGYSSSELHYNLGRIYYLKGLYKNSLTQWLENYEDFVSSPEIMYALGNAFYHENNVESAKAEYQKLISAYEYEAEKIRMVVPSREDHIKVFESLSAAYNNLGVIYLRKGGDTRSNICFWKSIDYANRLGKVNEFARVNLARTVRKAGDTRQPILDENIPFSVDIYRAEMRDRFEFK
jgi:tetratricopeptide (TPR) repeat protein